MSPNIMKGFKKCKHILELSNLEKQQFLDSFDIVFSDCDGTVWAITGPILNNATGINLIKDAGKQFLFISNNGIRTFDEYLNKIQKIGVLNVTQNDILLPVKALANYLKNHYPDETCYCMGSNVFYNSLKESGITVQNITPPLSNKVEDLHKVVRPSKEVKILAVDQHSDMNYAEFIMIHEYLLKNDCTVFVNVDALIPLAPDLTVMGPAVLLDAVAASAGKQPIIFGKPSELMGDFLMEKYKMTNHKRSIFVGDNLDTDIKFGIQEGMQTLLVLTGTHTKEEMFQLPFEDQPDYYADKLADFVEFFRDLNDN